MYCRSRPHYRSDLGWLLGVAFAGHAHPVGPACSGLHLRSVLQHASGFLRSMLAKGIKLRVAPELHFVYDESVARGAHLSRLIDDAIASGTPDPDDGGDKSGQ